MSVIIPNPDDPPTGAREFTPEQKMALLTVVDELEKAIPETSVERLLTAIFDSKERINDADTD